MTDRQTKVNLVAAESYLATKRKRIGTTKELIRLYETMAKLRVTVAGNKDKVGKEAYDAKAKEIRKAVTDPFEQFLARRSFAKESSLYDKRSVGVPTLNIESKKGWDLAPAVEGKVGFGDLRAKRDIKDMVAELNARGIATPQPHKFKELKALLQDHEKKLLKEEDPTLKPDELTEKAKYFTIQCQRNVFAFINEI